MLLWKLKKRSRVRGSRQNQLNIGHEQSNLSFQISSFRNLSFLVVTFIIHVAYITILLKRTLLKRLNLWNRKIRKICSSLFIFFPSGFDQSQLNSRIFASKYLVFRKWGKPVFGTQMIYLISSSLPFITQFKFEKFLKILLNLFQGSGIPKPKR